MWVRVPPLQLIFYGLGHNKKTMADIKVTEQRFSELLDSEKQLRALEAGGVDNWAGYQAAMEGYWEEKNLEKRVSVLLEKLEEHINEPSERGAGLQIDHKAIDLVVNFVRNETK